MVRYYGYCSKKSRGMRKKEENGMLTLKNVNNDDMDIMIKRPKKERKLPEVLSQDEVLKILNALDNKKHKAILFMVYSAGLRVGEVVRLKITEQLKKVYKTL